MPLRVRYWPWQHRSPTSLHHSRTRLKIDHLDWRVFPCVHIPRHAHGTTPGASITICIDKTPRILTNRAFFSRKTDSCCSNVHASAVRLLRRLFVNDFHDGKHFLMDSGAEISVVLSWMLVQDTIFPSLQQPFKRHWECVISLGDTDRHPRYIQAELDSRSIIVIGESSLACIFHVTPMEQCLVLISAQMPLLLQLVGAVLEQRSGDTWQSFGSKKLPGIVSLYNST